MGHDILAESRCLSHEVACMRRSAFDPCNAVIYEALGVTDEAFRGVSGSGIQLAITRDQLKTANEVLDRKSFQGMQLDASAMELKRIFVEKCAGPFVYFDAGTDSPDVSREREFLARCIGYLELTGEPDLLVLFS